MKCHDRVQEVTDSLYRRFKKHGVPRNVIEDVLNLGLIAGLSLEQSEVGARISLSKRYGFEEYFTIEDIMTATGENEEEVLRTMDRCKKELIAEGKNVGDYFRKLRPAPYLKDLFKNGGYLS